VQILESGGAIPDLDRLIFEHALNQTWIGIETKPAGEGGPLDISFNHKHSALGKVLSERLR
jgi:hypothetical protein